MKKLLLISCILSFCLLCSCVDTVNTSSADDISQNASVNTSDISESASDISEITSDDPAQSEFALSDYMADEQLLKKTKRDLEEMLESVDTEQFVNSRLLTVVPGIKISHSFEEANALLNDFRNTTQDYNWYKKVPLTTVHEEQGLSNEEAFESSGIVCLDSGCAYEDAGLDCNAHGHTIDLSDRSLRFAWEYLYLAPAISELCGKTFDDIPTEADFIAATQAFFETYLPQYLPENAELYVVFPSYHTADVYVKYPAIQLDPDNPGITYSPTAAVLKFNWYEGDFVLAKSNEKALLKSLRLYFPLQYEDIEPVTKAVITADEAWKNVVSGDYYKNGYDGEAELLFGVGDIFVHDYYIDYYNYNDTYQPCYTLICSAKDSRSLFEIRTRAL